MKHSSFTALILWMGIFLICPVIRAENSLPVYVSIPPQKFFIQSIGKDRVSVSVMVAPGANPHNYEPTPDQMKTLSSSRMYFAIGDPFETVWLKKFSAANPNMKIIHTEDGIEKKPVHRRENIFFSSEGSEETHSHAHGIFDPHIWLSPPLVMLQARNILLALVDEMPAQREFFEANYKNLVHELIALDADLRGVFKDDANKEFLVFHPSWGYFADAYRLTQNAVESEGREPKAKEMAHLIAYAKNRGIQAVFVQPQFSAKHAEIIAKEINGRVIHADPLAEDWMVNIKSVANAIQQALR